MKYGAKPPNSAIFYDRVFIFLSICSGPVQFSLVVFFVGDNLQSLPPRGRGTAAGFPETNEMSFGGSRVGGGRSLRNFEFGLISL